jgi:ribosomal protein S18 acetylase RimI-like enzyme
LVEEPSRALGRITNASLGDLRYIGVLQQTIFRPSLWWSDWLLQRHLEGEGRWARVYKIEEKVVAYMLYHREGSIACLDILGVAPDYQKLGIGQKLISRLKAETSGLGKIVLFTFADSDTNLYFYRNLGFRLVREPCTPYTDGRPRVCLEYPFLRRIKSAKL